MSGTPEFDHKDFLMTHILISDTAHGSTAGDRRPLKVSAMAAGLPAIETPLDSLRLQRCPTSDSSLKPIRHQGEAAIHFSS